MNLLSRFFLGGMRLIAIFGLTGFGYMAIRISGKLGLDAAVGYLLSSSPTICLDIGVLASVWFIRRKLAERVKRA